jgi:hypothetical protein
VCVDQYLIICFPQLASPGDLRRFHVESKKATELDAEMFNASIQSVLRNDADTLHVSEHQYMLATKIKHAIF